MLRRVWWHQVIWNWQNPRLRTLKRVSEKANGNGRIIHEMSSNGFVYNKGNMQETPHFALAVWKVFEWTGDKEFLAGNVSLY